MSWIDEHEESMYRDGQAYESAVLRAIALPNWTIIKDCQVLMRAVSLGEIDISYRAGQAIWGILEKVGNVPESEFVRELMDLTPNQKRFLCSVLVNELKEYEPNEADYGIL